MSRLLQIQIGATASVMLVLALALASWAVFGVGSVHAQDGGTGNTPPASDVRTPLTYADIERDNGQVQLNWALPSGVSNLTVYIQRQARVDDDWTVLRQVFQGEDINSYLDFDVIPGVQYAYRIIIRRPNGIVYATHRFVKTASYLDTLSIRGTDTAHFDLRLQLDESVISATNHQVRLKFYDHAERVEVIGRATDYLRVTGNPHELVFSTSATKGEILTVEAEIQQTIDDGATWTDAPYTISPVTVMAGLVTPSNPTEITVSRVSDENGSNTEVVTWSLATDNKQALGYDIQRRPVKPRTSTYERMGTTVGNSITLYDDNPPVSYHYKVTPIGMDGRLASAQATETVFPPIPFPTCWNPDTLEDPYPVDEIFLYRDVTSEVGEEHPRTYDMMAMDGKLNLCIGLVADDYQMERKISYQNVIDESCVDPDWSCNIASSANPEIEVLDVEPRLWGFPKWQAMEFSDSEELPPGRYWVNYRVCMVDFEHCTPWTRWEKFFVGVTEVPFMAPGPPTPKWTDRVFEDGLTIF